MSDVHLGMGTPLAEMRFGDFLLSIKDRAKGLYVLGDLFEFWFEYRRVVPKIGFEILARMRDLAESGTKIFLFRGNHDIWFKGWLEHGLKVEGVFDEQEMVIDGLRVYLAHGDALDRGFVPRLFRSLMRSPINGFLFSCLHPDIGISLARRIAIRSRRGMEERGAAQKVQAAMVEFAREKIAGGYDVVMLGHSHIPEMSRIGSGVYINTGDWMKSFTYGMIREGKATLEYF